MEANEAEIMKENTENLTDDNEELLPEALSLCLLLG